MGREEQRICGNGEERWVRRIWMRDFLICSVLEEGVFGNGRREILLCFLSQQTAYYRATGEETYGWRKCTFALPEKGSLAFCENSTIQGNYLLSQTFTNLSPKGVKMNPSLLYTSTSTSISLSSGSSDVLRALTWTSVSHFSSPKATRFDT